MNSGEETNKQQANRQTKQAQDFALHPDLLAIAHRLNTAPNVDEEITALREFQTTFYRLLDEQNDRS